MALPHLITTALQPAIQPLCGLNLAGLQGCVRLFPVGNVLAVPPIVAGVHVGEVSLAQPMNYADIWFAEGSGSFEEPEEEQEQGTFYKQKLSVQIPRDEPDVAGAVAQYRALRYFVALYQDANGYTKLVGSPRYPLRFEAALSTGQSSGDKNGHALVFAVQAATPAAFYHAFAPSAGNRRVFSNGFSFGFQRT